MNRRSQKRIKDMANLNFQQPPRSIPNQSLSRSAFNSSSLSGHVTPTSGIFPGGTNSFTPQLSPNRSLPPMANRNLFSQQRAFSERRGPVGTVIQDWNSSSISNLGSMVQNSRSSYSSHNNNSNLQSMFNNNNSNNSCASGDVSNSPSLLDLSEFPSLTSRGQDSIPQSNSIPGKQPYGKVGMVKAPATEPSEFMMSNEDFPALPGTQPTSVAENCSTSGSSSVNSEKLVNHESNSQSDQVMSPSINRLGNTSAAPGAEKHQLQQQSQQHQQFLHQHLQQHQQQQQQHQLHQPQHQVQPSSQKQNGVQTFADGKVTNIPASMMKDQFGIIGLLTFIRAAESDKNVVSLALGQDLTALGLNLNSPGNLHSTFAGPWTNGPCKPHDLECHVPPEYVVNHSIRHRLPEVKLQRYKEDVLFFIFYMYVGDTLQMAAASELYNREWRFHIEEKVWISHTPALDVLEKTPNYERGTYFYFDALKWKKLSKEFILDYSKLDNRPLAPSFNNVT